MTMCWVPDCRHYNVRETCRFFRFPRSGKERSKWKRLLRRDTEPGPGAYVCSCHFRDGKRENGPELFLEIKEISSSLSGSTTTIAESSFREIKVCPFQMDQAEIFCKFCREDITDKQFQVLGEVALDVLSTLSLNVNLDDGDEYMCIDCSVKLFAAYDFKMMCLSTEHSLVPYIDFENASQIDLKDAYLKIKGRENITVTWDQQVCRLCMNIVDDEFISVEELYRANMVDSYIPEINFSITKDPVVCKKCWNSLRVHIDFLKKQVNIEEKIKIEAQDSEDNEKKPVDNLFIKSEEIDVLLQENSENTELFSQESNEVILKDETIEEHCVIKGEIEDLHTSCSEYALNDSEAMCKNDDNKTSCKPDFVAPLLKLQMYKCNECGYQNKRKNNLNRHQIIHKDPSTTPTYKCSKCDFQSKRKGNLVAHQLMHKDPLEMQMYKCDKCDFQSKWKHSLLSHQIVHKDPSEIQMYKCDKCDYETKWKKHLKLHQVKHQNSLEVQIYRCNECDFQSKRKSSLLKHQIRHKDPLEIQMYKCDECDFQCKWRYSLRKHQMKHKDFLDIQMYKCENCDYQSKTKHDLQQHEIIHRDPTEVQMYKCDECDFQSKWKNGLEYHQMEHGNPLKIQMYKCEKCDYVTKRKNNFKDHQIRHESSSEMQVYKCNECKFQSRRKDSFRKHKKVHQDPLETKLYKCDKCEFQTKWKDNVQVHQIMHKNPSEVEMYKCEKCDFETKWKHGLKKHQQYLHST